MISSGLKKYLLLKLNKKEEREILPSDFDKIEEISLNNADCKTYNVEYDLKDLMLFRNLKFLSIQNFKIRNYETNIINRIQSLCAVQMVNCEIISKSTLQNNIELISFQNCKKLSLYYIRNLKKIKILKVENCKSINLNKIYVLSSIEKVYLKNVRIRNINKVLKLPNLKYINLAESKYSKSFEKKLPQNLEIDKSIL